MRDRLIELISRVQYMGGLEGRLADYLLAEGVIVPPCKVGDKVYCIRFDRSQKPYIKPLGVLSVTCCGKGAFTIFTTRDDRLGSTVFLTKEEAEKALAERSER